MIRTYQNWKDHLSQKLYIVKLKLKDAKRFSKLRAHCVNLVLIIEKIEKNTSGYKMNIHNSHPAGRLFKP